MHVSAADKGSFRDRHNQVFLQGDRVIRGISETALENWLALQDGALHSKYEASGHLVATRLVENGLPDTLLGEEASTWGAFLEHDRIPFLNYSYEWCFGMLKDAALLHLDLMEAALGENLILKDSSSFNIHFVGATPVFIDIPSFEKYQSGMPWVGFRQFCQHFLYPLMLQSFKGISLRSWLRGSIEGITPDECNRMMSLRDRFRPGVFTLVYLQSKLVATMGDRKQSIVAESRESEFGKEIILSNVRKLRRIVSRLQWRVGRSQWSDYTSTHSYESDSFETKCGFVKDIVGQRRRSLAWDIGCNTGHFSRMLAENTDYVAAFDIDELCIETLYQDLKRAENRNILPLVFDLTNPSPPLGWRCEERHGLDTRSRPELILCLALIHHLVITGNIPVRQVLDWLASFRAEIIIEMLTKEDGMVKQLLLNKDDQYDDFTVECFEETAKRYFMIEKKIEVMPGQRYLYHLVPKDAGHHAGGS